ncbi:MAG: hypothetical protein QXO70_00915 [Candidatus Pacearchaeota archaeon]
MAEKQAVFKTAKLWQWLTETGTKNKQAYPKYLKEIAYAIEDCPVCNFYREETSKGCKKCPVGNNGNDICLQQDSTFKKWLYSTEEVDTKHYAEIIFKRLKIYYKNEFGGRIR